MAHDYQGVNYTIDVTQGVALHCIFSRPNISFAEGAQAADEMRTVHLELSGREDINGLILDMRRAPSMGPKTRAYFRSLFGYWRDQDKPLAVLLDEEQAILVMQLRGIISDAAPDHVRIAHATDAAYGWLHGEEPGGLISGTFRLPKL